jgi:hypothetical protein
LNFLDKTASLLDLPKGAAELTSIFRPHFTLIHLKSIYFFSQVSRLQILNRNEEFAMKALIFILSILTISLVAMAKDGGYNTSISCKSLRYTQKDIKDDTLSERDLVDSEHNLVFSVLDSEFRVGLDNNQTLFVVDHKPRADGLQENGIFRFKGDGSGFDTTYLVIKGSQLEFQTQSERSNTVMRCHGKNIQRALRLTLEFYEKVNSPNEEPEPAPAATPVVAPAPAADPAPVAASGTP